MLGKNTRLTITLSHHTHSVVAEMAALQGTPKSKVITDLLDSVTPVLERTCYVLKIADRATTGLNDDIKQSMERSEAKIQVMMEEAMGQLDMLADGFLSPSEDGSASGGGVRATRAGVVGESDTLPPHSNTGVTIGDKSKTSNKNNK